MHGLRKNYLETAIGLKVKFSRHEYFKIDLSPPKCVCSYLNIFDKIPQRFAYYASLHTEN